MLLNFATNYEFISNRGVVLTFPIFNQQQIQQVRKEALLNPIQFYASKIERAMTTNQKT